MRAYISRAVVKFPKGGSTVGDIPWKKLTRRSAEDAVLASVLFIAPPRKKGRRKRKGEIWASNQFEPSSLLPSSLVSVSNLLHLLTSCLRCRSAFDVLKSFFLQEGPIKCPSYPSPFLSLTYVQPIAWGEGREIGMIARASSARLF